MSRACSDHIEGYKVCFLASDDGWAYAATLTKGGVLPRRGYVLAVPYQAARQLPYGYVDFCEHGLAGGTPLPAGAVLLGFDAAGELRVEARADQPGQPDPGYHPVAPDALLGHLRAHHLLSPAQLASLQAGYTTAVADLCAEFDAAEAAGVAFPATGNDPLAGELAWARLASLAPAAEGAALLHAELDELAPLLSAEEQAATAEPRDRFCELSTALWSGRSRRAVVALVARADTLPYTRAPLDPGPLEGRPDQVECRDELTLVYRPAALQYNDSNYDLIAPGLVTGVCPDRAAADALAEDVRQLRMLVGLGHRVADRIPGARAEYSWVEEGDPAALTVYPVPVAGPAGSPRTFTAGCAYVVVGMPADQRHRIHEPALEFAHFDTAFPSPTEALAALARTTGATGRPVSDEGELPSLAWLEDQEALAAYRDASAYDDTPPGLAARAGVPAPPPAFAAAWAWAGQLPGRVVGRAACRVDYWGEPDVDTWVVVAIPLPGS